MHISLNEAYEIDDTHRRFSSAKEPFMTFAFMRTPKIITAINLRHLKGFSDMS